MSYSVKSIRKKFAEKGVFYTDEKLARMLKEAVGSCGEVTEIYDPTCGNGNLLAVFPDNVRKFGQELDPMQAQEARERLVNADIVAGDTLVNPAFADRKFRHIVANYPFSVKWDPREDPRWADAPTLPPPSKADYAFIMHILSMLADNGVAAVLGFPGICYRGQREGKIREWIIKQRIIESVTHIEGGYFEDTNVATVLIVFRKGKPIDTVRFVNHEEGVERMVTVEEIATNDYSLSVNQYAHREEERKEADPVALEIKARDDVLRRLRAQLDFSVQAAEVHKMLGLPPLPPISRFIADILKILAQYE